MVDNNRPRGKVTIREVAAQAGTSMSTVSLALRGDPRVLPETSRRVKEAAAQLGYRPNFAAQMMRLNRPKQVGVVWQLNSPYHAELASNLLLQAQRLGYSCLYQAPHSHAHLDGTEDFVDPLVRACAEAMIIIDPDISPETLRIWQERLPLVVIGQPQENAVWDQVFSDAHTGLKQALEHLHRQGVNEAWYLSNHLSRSGKLRQTVVQQLAAEIGVNLHIRQAGATTSDGYMATKQFIEECELSQSSSAFDAARPKLGETVGFICYDDEVALGSLLAFRSHGWRVPQDVCLIGYDNSALAKQSGVELTSVERDCELQAEFAMYFAVERIRQLQENFDAPMSAQIGELPTRLVVRSSSQLH